MTKYAYSPFDEDIYIFRGIQYSPLKEYWVGITYPDTNYEIVKKNTQMFSIEYLYEGECVIQQNDKIFKAQAGDFLLLHPHSYVHYFSNPKMPCKKIWVLSYGLKYINYLLEIYGISHITHLPGFHKPDIFEKCFESAIRNDVNSSRDLELYIHMLLAEVSDFVIQSDNKYLSSANQLKLFLENNIHNKIALKDCCDYIGLGKSQLTNIFKSAYNVSAMTYLMNLKIQSAKYSLTHTNMTVSEIAKTYAFYDAYHFSSAFKNKVGVSPTEYRLHSEELKQTENDA